MKLTVTLSRVKSKDDAKLMHTAINESLKLIISALISCHSIIPKVYMCSVHSIEWYTLMSMAWAWGQDLSITVCVWV